MKRVVLLLALAFLLAPMVALADAVPMLDFGITAPTAGTISYDGNGGPLIGSGISVDSVVGLNTPLNSGVTLTIAGGILNFTTGGLTGATSDTWSFGGGGNSFISITGSCTTPEGAAIPSCFSEDIRLNGAPWLLWGGFGNATVTTFGDTFKIASASFYDYKCWDLLAFFGLGDYAFAPLGGNFNISFNAAGVPPGAFASTVVLSGDVVNTVPEPGTLALLGTGLLSIAGLVRRKLTS